MRNRTVAASILLVLGCGESDAPPVVNGADAAKNACGGDAPLVFGSPHAIVGGGSVMGIA